jgi:hypothetical protein
VSPLTCHAPRRSNLSETRRKPFSELAKIRERREDSTLDIYRHWLKKVVLPQLGCVIVTMASPTKPEPTTDTSSPSTAELRFPIVVLGGG